MYFSTLHQKHFAQSTPNYVEKKYKKDRESLIQVFKEKFELDFIEKSKSYLTYYC